MLRDMLVEGSAFGCLRTLSTFGQNATPGTEFQQDLVTVTLLRIGVSKFSSISKFAAASPPGFMMEPAALDGGWRPRWQLGQFGKKGSSRVLGFRGCRALGFGMVSSKKILVLGHVHPLAHKDVLRRSATRMKGSVCV